MTVPGKPWRILELGDRTLFKLVMPEATTLYWSGPRLEQIPLSDYTPLTGRAFRAICSDLAVGRYNLVVCHPPEKSIWREIRRGRKDARHLWMHRLLHRLPGARRPPLVVVDSSDPAVIPAHNMALLARATLYFKRELALDPERLLPSRSSACWRPILKQHVHKLQPFALGIPRWNIDRLPPAPVPKTSDVFFAGQRHTLLRRAELPQLMALAERGFVLDLPTHRLPPAEFYQRCAAAWLVWSPEGAGWDCFRHYEAAACRSVPVMNQPTIRCRAPLRDGEHGFYYQPAGRRLTETLLRGLADKARLLRMGEAGRAYVLEHHTHAAACADILAALTGRSDGE